MKPPHPPRVLFFILFLIVSAVLLTGATHAFSAARAAPSRSVVLQEGEPTPSPTPAPSPAPTDTTGVIALTVVVVAIILFGILWGSRKPGKPGVHKR